MIYRTAHYEDKVSIATLHAESWRAHYRGAYRDQFLDGPVFDERMKVWEERLSVPSANQFVVVAEEDDRTVGFACAYGRDDERWGTLLDNIHVMPDRQRRGMGRHLLSEVAAWCSANYPDCGLYLWVLAQNTQAQRFYRGLGALDCGGGAFEPPGGGRITSRRYAWPSVMDIRRVERNGVLDDRAV